MDRQANRAPNCEVIYGLAHTINDVRTDIARVTQRGFTSLEREQDLRRQITEERQHAQDTSAADSFTRAFREQALHLLEANANTHARLRPLVIRELDALDNIENINWKSIDGHIAEHIRYSMCSPTWKDMLRVHNRERLKKAASFLGKLVRLPNGQSNT